ncbi:hypothetical protein ACFX2I_028308 [Malus domestica]
MEMSVSSLARMAQASDESPMDYLTRFKSVRNWCRVPLPEVKFIRLALNGLNVEYKKKFLGANFRDMYELAQHVEQYDYLLREEKISKAPSRGTIYKNPTVSYASTEGECVSVDAAEIVIDKPYVCKALTQIDSKEVKTRSATEETMKTSKVYTFDITKADVIFINCYQRGSSNFGLGITFLRPKSLKERYIANTIIQVNIRQITASCFETTSKAGLIMANSDFWRRK